MLPQTIENSLELCHINTRLNPIENLRQIPAADANRYQLQFLINVSYKFQDTLRTLRKRNNFRRSKWMIADFGVRRRIAAD